MISSMSPTRNLHYKTLILKLNIDNAYFLYTGCRSTWIHLCSIVKLEDKNTIIIYYFWLSISTLLLHVQNLLNFWPLIFFCCFFLLLSHRNDVWFNKKWKYSISNFLFNPEGLSYVLWLNNAFLYNWCKRCSNVK